MTSELTSVPTEQEAIANLAWDNEILQERLAQLELQLEDQGWEALSGANEREFSREGIDKINALARLMYLKNPLIQRGVNVQAYYVFGQGIQVGAADEEIAGVVEQFWSDAKNQAELTSHQALLGKETELALFGNLFFVLFTNPTTGRVRVRTIPVNEIEEIICNPEDAKDPWYYKRVWAQRGIDGRTNERTLYYRDWRYTGREKPDGEIENAVVYHVKVGGLPDMRFGVSEVYAALDWAKAYKQFLEDWATIVRAYSRFAWNINVKTKQGIATAKTKLNTTLGGGNSETNPPPVVGSTFIGHDTTAQPIRTAGATTSAEDGRRLLLMVAATMGLPETFFGDVSIGTLATAKSMDRPTELKMVSRQTLWHDVIEAILRYAVVAAVRARVIKASVDDEDDGTPKLVFAMTADPITGKEVERDETLTVDFPPVLEHDVAASVTAVVQAATLGGSQLAPTIDAKTVTRLLLTALGETDVQAIMDEVYPPGEEEEEPQPVEDETELQIEPGDGEEPDAATIEAAMVEAVRELRAALEKVTGSV